jgi:hypothetical protein
MTRDKRGRLVSSVSKSKTYWDHSSGEKDPFSVPKSVFRNLADCAHRFENGENGNPPAIKYLWIYVTEEGLERKRAAEDSGPRLSDEDWLNIIDEACSLGAEWMIIYVGARLSECPEVWRMCDWAQQEYEMRVGLHLSGNCLRASELEYLFKLDSERTYVVADEADAAALETLRERGVNVCVANVRKPADAKRCESPEVMACVGIDGELFTCGLVLGVEEYQLGNVQGEPLQKLIKDQSLRHAVSDIPAYRGHDHNCDGCPPHIARRAAESLPE